MSKKQKYEIGERVWVSVELVEYDDSDNTYAIDAQRLHTKDIRKYAPEPKLELIPTSERLPTVEDASPGGRVLVTAGAKNWSGAMVNFVHANNWKYWFSLSGITFPEPKEPETITITVLKKEWEALKAKIEKTLPLQ